MSNWQYINPNIDVTYDYGQDSFALDANGNINYIVGNSYLGNDGQFAYAIDQNLFVINKDNGAAGEGISLTSGDANGNEGIIQSLDITSTNKYIFARDYRGMGKASIESLDNSLNSEWKIEFDIGNSLQQGIVDIESDQNGNIYVALKTYKSINGETYNGGYDLWGDICLIKLSSEGDTLWTKVYGGSRGEIPKKLSFNDNGDLLVFGETNGGFLDFNYSEDRRNFLLVLDNADGEIKSSAIGNKNFYDLAKDNNSNEIIHNLSQTDSNNDAEIRRLFPQSYELADGFISANGYLKNDDKIFAFGYSRDSSDPAIHRPTTYSFEIPFLQIKDYSSGNVELNFDNLSQLNDFNPLIKLEKFENDSWTTFKSLDINSNSLTLSTSEIEGISLRINAILYDNSDESNLRSEYLKGTYFDDGDAVFVISGASKIGELLSITESTADPDGTGTLSYVWQSSSDETSWTQIGTDSTYTLTSSELGKKVRTILSYTDDQGFSESVTTTSVDLIDDGDAIFAISGTAQVGQLLSITESKADPDGTGSLSYIWQSSSDGTSWSQIGADSTYTLTSLEEGKKVRTILSYTDDHGFSESVIASTIDIPIRTYSLYLSFNLPQEGYKLTTTAQTSNVSVGTKLYWSVSGANVNPADFASGSLYGEGTVGSDGSFSFEHLLANDGVIEGYETFDIKLFSDNSLSSQIGLTKSILIRDSALTEQIVEINSQLNTITELLTVGQEYILENIRDYDGNLHANTGSVSDETKTSYKYQGLLDVNKDGTKEAIYTNKESGRWVTASVISTTGLTDYSDYGKDGTTRVVGIYMDPLVTSGEVEQFGPHDSQRRFQNDLKIDNLIAKTAGDYDGDGFQEVYWKTNDGTAYLRALMHADGNIQYANYQSKEQMSYYLTSNGYESVFSDII